MHMAMQTWFVVRGGNEEGPYSGTALKDMAATGKLKPTDLVRRGDVETARPASQIKGLFPTPSEAAAVKSGPRAGPSQGTSDDRLTPPARKPRKYLLIGAGVFAGLLVTCLVCAGIGSLVGNRGGSGKHADDGNPSKALPAQPGQTGDRADSTKAGADPSKVDYAYDFAKDDYETIPVGAKKETRKQVIDKGGPPLQGKPETAEGYVDSSGKFVRHGVSTAWYDRAESSKLQEEKYLHGKLHGIMTGYAQNGNKVFEFPFVHGKKHGVMKGWFDKGEQEYEIGFIDGKQHGPTRYWHKSGRTNYTATYRDGLRHGEYVSYADGSFKGYDGKNYDPFEFKHGTYQNGVPVGEWRFGYISDTRLGYFVEAKTGKWNGGLIRQFVARVQLHMLEKYPTHMLVFDPQGGVANAFADSPEAFFEVFGRPASDTRDLEQSSAPPNLRDKYRKWRYDLKDGSMNFRVAPTQDGKILIKSGR
jgi:hypothetical protein